MARTRYCHDKNAARTKHAVKFFPAEAAGGLAMIKAMAAPYVNMKFMPTGGINAKNLNSYLDFPKIIACGGSWMVSDELVKAGDFDKITTLTKEAVSQMLGFELRHIGINASDEVEADHVATSFEKLFGFVKNAGNSSIFAGTGIEVMKKPYLVPESKIIKDLFRELQQSKKQIAVLIDEYGGFAGIVTMEDLVEEVMGDIEDEYDPISFKIKKIDDSTYLIDGMTTIDELNIKLDLNLFSENYDTISGYLIDQIGSIPQEHDERTIEIGNLVFKLESVKNKRIDKIKLFIGKEDEQDI
jgi:hypothetical protein